MTEVSFPPSRSLPPVLLSDDWVWHRPSDDQCFWIGEDPEGTRWLVKFRGGFCAVRERAFSIIAQALGISCQSSTYLKMLNSCPVFKSEGENDIHQLAILFLDEHRHGQLCEDCPLDELKMDNVKTLRGSRVIHAIDIARGEMLGMLCEMHEPPGRLFTHDHMFVQIDNELMFSRSAGAVLWESPWVTDDGLIIQSGLDEAVCLCKEVLLLHDEVFLEATQLPPSYKPSMAWNLRDEIDNIRPRAQTFLEKYGDTV